MLSERKLIKQWEMLLLAGSLVDFPVDLTALGAGGAGGLATERVTGRHAGGKVVDLPDAKKLTRIVSAFLEE